MKKTIKSKPMTEAEREELMTRIREANDRAVAADDRHGGAVCGGEVRRSADMKTKIYIVTKFKQYDSTDEKYSHAEAHTSRESAENAMRHMIEADVDMDIDGSEDVTRDEYNSIIKNAVEAAITEGENSEEHDAILYYGDAEAYYDIFETSINI